MANDELPALPPSGDPLPLIEPPTVAAKDAMDPARLDALRRHSGLRIDAAGRFHFRERVVENERVQALFHRGLRWDAAERKAVLAVGAQWAFIEFVDDVAFFVERAHDGVLRLRSGEEVPLDLGAYEWVHEALYVDLPDGRRAKLDRLAVMDLASVLVEHEAGFALELPGGRLVVRSGGGPGHGDEGAPLAS